MPGRRLVLETAADVLAAHRPPQARAAYSCLVQAAPGSGKTEAIGPLALQALWSTSPTPDAPSALVACSLQWATRATRRDRDSLRPRADARDQAGGGPASHMRRGVKAATRCAVNSESANKFSGAAGVPLAPDSAAAFVKNLHRAPAPCLNLLMGPGRWQRPHRLRPRGDASPRRRVSQLRGARPRPRWSATPVCERPLCNFLSDVPLWLWGPIGRTMRAQCRCFSLIVPQLARSMEGVAA